MSVRELIAAGRAAHNHLMTDTCIIDRANTPSLNTTTGGYDTTYTVIYSGKCRVKGPRAGSITGTDRDVGDAEQSMNRQTLVLPHPQSTFSGEFGDGFNISPIHTGDRVRITGSNPGREFRVVGLVDTTTMTARAILIEKVDP